MQPLAGILLLLLLVLVLLLLEHSVRSWTCPLVIVRFPCLDIRKDFVGLLNLSCTVRVLP